MGSLTLPASGLVYIDTMTLIYTVERYPAYLPLLQPLWLAAQAGTIQVVSSELTLMETLVGPLKSGNAAVEAAFEQVFVGTDCACCRFRKPCCAEPPDCGRRPSCERPTRFTPRRPNRRVACCLSRTTLPSAVL